MNNTDWAIDSEHSSIEENSRNSSWFRLCLGWKVIDNWWMRLIRWYHVDWVVEGEEEEENLPSTWLNQRMIRERIDRGSKEAWLICREKKRGLSYSEKEIGEWEKRKKEERKGGEKMLLPFRLFSFTLLSFNIQVQIWLATVKKEKTFDRSK